MQIISNKEINLLIFNSLPREQVTAFSTTIQGGVGSENYASFNLSPFSGDDPDCVNKNQELLTNVIGVSVENLYIPYQTHQDKIQVVDEAFLEKTDLEKATLLNGVDAMITDRRNICIGVTTADCVPILLYDPVRNVLAAVHAGWKSTVLEIVKKTVVKMTERFACDPKDIQAGIAPCISQEKFEVGDEVVDAFVRAGFPLQRISYRNTETGKMHIDLQEANVWLLAEAGVMSQNVEVANMCTYSNPDKFFSARRQTIHSGRMLTGGVIR